MREVNHLAWIPIVLVQPAPGQSILGAAAKPREEEGYGVVEYHFWEENFDPQEPLGAMSHWQPALSRGCGPLDAEDWTE